MHRVSIEENPMRNIRPHCLELQSADCDLRQYGLTVSFKIWSRKLVYRGVYAWVEGTVHVPRHALRTYIKNFRRKCHRPITGRAAIRLYRSMNPTSGTG